MSGLTTSSTSASSRQWTGAIFLVVCAALFVVRGFAGEKVWVQSLDFKTVYSGAECLADGCDPYDSVQIEREYLKRGGVPGPTDPAAFRPHEPVYPPSLLFYLIPFTWMRWPIAHLVWLAFATAIFLTGLGLIARLCLRMAPIATALGLGTLLLTSMVLIELGQPAELVIGLGAIGTWCLLECRFLVPGALCFAFALIFKPHLVGPVWVYFALCRGEYRRWALRIALLTILLCLPGITYAGAHPASAHWMGEMRGNITSLAAHGKANDPGPANGDAKFIVGLQPILALVRDDAPLCNRVAWGLGLLLSIGWVAITFRTRPSRERDYCAIATILLISTVPVYHREYDVSVLVLIFPAYAHVCSRLNGWRIALPIATISTLLFASTEFDWFVNRYVLPPGAQATRWQIFMWQRSASWSVLLLMLVFLAAQGRWMEIERRETAQGR